MDRTLMTSLRASLASCYGNKEAYSSLSNISDIDCFLHLTRPWSFIHNVSRETLSLHKWWRIFVPKVSDLCLYTNCMYAWGEKKLLGAQVHSHSTLLHSPITLLLLSHINKCPCVSCLHFNPFMHPALLDSVIVCLQVLRIEDEQLSNKDTLRVRLTPPI